MKRMLFLIISLFVCLTECLGQYICEGASCSNKPRSEQPGSPQYITNPDTIRFIAENVNENDLDCPYPTFWTYSNENRLIIRGAKATGQVVKVYRGTSCDIHKSILAVPILYKGQKEWAATGYDGQPVFVDHTLAFLLLEQSYWCDGLPTEPTKYHKCAYCGNSYASVKFKAKIGDSVSTSTYYSNCKGTCSKSPNGNHDNLALSDITKCQSARTGNVFSTQ
jgi:hypothetical protein